jgi:polyvinyl alcohol dehydrogenase (cytochrome)
MALNLNTGAIKWSYRTIPSDDWTVGCILPPFAHCPPNHGPDFDFGSGPNLFTVRGHGQPRDLVGAGQKSGIYWALDPDTGQVVWSTQVGAGGSLGGIEWGSATDGNRVYVAISDLEGTAYTLKNGQTVHGGSWSALDAATGAILWQVADPSGYVDVGSMTVANGVVFGSSMVQSPGFFGPPPPFPADGPKSKSMYAFDAATGAVLWTKYTGNSVNAGPSVVKGTVYWGSGYANLGLGYGSFTTGKLYAFSIPGCDQQGDNGGNANC